MEELLEVLGLDEDTPTAKVVQTVKGFQRKLKDKDAIIVGLQEKIGVLEDKIDDVMDGIAEARVKDLVQKVQNETGRHVGGDHIETLQEKARRYLYAGKDEKEDIYEDMKAHTIAYGNKVGIDEKLRSLDPSRNEEGEKQSKEYLEAEALVESGDADNWDEALQMVIDKKNKRQTEEDN